MGRKPINNKSNLCSKCKKLNENKLKRYCSNCHNEYMRIWRKTHKQTETQRLKGIVRSKTRVMIKRGKLKRQPCLVCKETKVEAHHEDYSKPFDVIWLCKICHINHHKQKKLSLTTTDIY